MIFVIKICYEIQLMRFVNKKFCEKIRSTVKWKIDIGKESERAGYFGLPNIYE